MLTILGTGALLACVASAILVYGIRQADTHLGRASSSQKQLEYLMLLSGRVANYGLGAIVSLQSPNTSRLTHGRKGVQAIMAKLAGAIADDVLLQSTQNGMTAAATKSIGLARLRAQFEILDRQLIRLETTVGTVAEKTAKARQFLQAFGVGFAPLLAQAVENGRRDAANARAQMSDLRSRLTAFAVIWVLVAAISAIVLYRTAVRSILKRIGQAGLATRAIAAGKLDTRLAVEGHDELTLLMARFNRMAQKLSRRENRLISAQRDLRETIAGQTQQLSNANQRLEEIDLNRRRFFSDVSHELRTPLTVILGEAEVTLRQKKPRVAATVKKSFEVIEARAQNLRRRVDDLLRVARSESGELGLSFEPLDMNDIIREAIAEVEGLARQKSLTLESSKVVSEFFVSGDREWLRQVLSGLIANAIKFSTPGCSIDISTDKSEVDAVIEITDHGCGIANTDLPHVFERFYRGKHNNSERTAGHGIGLALAKWLIESHQGTIEIHSPNPSDGFAVAGTSETPGTLVRLRIPMTKKQPLQEGPG